MDSEDSAAFCSRTEILSLMNGGFQGNSLGAGEGGSVLTALVMLRDSVLNHLSYWANKHPATFPDLLSFNPHLIQTVM